MPWYYVSCYHDFDEENHPKKGGDSVTREAENAKYMNVGFRKDVVGWLEWASRENGGSQAAYIDRLIRADREKRITRSNDTARRYCAYLEAMGMTDELESLNR